MKSAQAGELNISVGPPVFLLSRTSTLPSTKRASTHSPWIPLRLLLRQIGPRGVGLVLSIGLLTWARRPFHAETSHMSDSLADDTQREDQGREVTARHADELLAM